MADISIELLLAAACFRGTLLPDPRYDAVRCIVMAAADDAEDMSGGNYTARVLLFDDKLRQSRDGLPHVQVRAQLCGRLCIQHMHMHSEKASGCL